MITFASFFSGIEAASSAFGPLGWECKSVAEIERFPCEVLSHHYPDVPNLGNVMDNDFLEKVRGLDVDVAIGGPPCQDYSVAGLRVGLKGNRGYLTLRWVEIIHAIRPRICAVTENVPGWLSANEGLAFGVFLAKLVGSDTPLVPPKKSGGRWTDAGMVTGPSGRAAWRILDAQYFGLAQRRERVFVVFCPADGCDPAEILFDGAGVRWNPPPSREAGQDITGTLNARTEDGRGLGSDFECGGGLVPVPILEAGARTGKSTDDPRAGMGIGKPGDPMFSLQAGKQHAVAFDCKAGGNTSFSIGEKAGTLRGDGHGGGHAAVAYDVSVFDPNQITSKTNRSIPKPGLSHTIPASSAAPIAFNTMAVRRLLPEECEILMGFPSGWTHIPIKNGKKEKMSADSPRYKSIGNSKAVPVVRWLGRRIQKAVDGGEDATTEPV